MMTPVILLVMVGLMFAHAEPPVYPQVRFQPLQNVLVLPSQNEQLKTTPDATNKQQDSEVKSDKGAEEEKHVSMEELRQVEGSVTGAYHVLLENGRLQRVEYTAAPRLPQKQDVKQEPEIRSWYYTQVPADILQRYYAQYYAQQQNSAYKRPSSTSQASSSNAQNFGQSATHGVNQATNNNVQVFHQGKQGASSAHSYSTAASNLNQQRVEYPAQPTSNTFQSRTFITTSSRSSDKNSQQNASPGNEVEIFEPVQRRTEQPDQQGFPPSNVIATIYYTDVNPITGPIYSFDQTPLIRVLRQA